MSAYDSYEETGRIVSSRRYFYKYIEQIGLIHSPWCVSIATCPLGSSYHIYIYTSLSRDPEQEERFKIFVPPPDLKPGLMRFVLHPVSYTHLTLPTSDL